MVILEKKKQKHKKEKTLEKLNKITRQPPAPQKTPPDFFSYFLFSGRLANTHNPEPPATTSSSPPNQPCSAVSSIEASHRPRTLPSPAKIKETKPLTPPQPHARPKPQLLPSDPQSPSSTDQHQTLSISAALLQAINNAFFISVGYNTNAASSLTTFSPPQQSCHRRRRRNT